MLLALSELSLPLCLVVGLAALERTLAIDVLYLLGEAEPLILTLVLKIMRHDNSPARVDRARKVRRA
jgi:hypothetical protein